MTIHTQPRKQGPLTPDERQQLVNFFTAIMDLRLEKTTDKGKNDNANK